MRFSILAGAVALVAPLAVEARTVTVSFDDINFDDTSYQENGFIFSNFNGLDNYGGISGALELQDGGTGTTRQATVTTVGGSAFTLLSANVRGVQRSELPYDSGLIEGTLNGEDAGRINYRPPERTSENVSFNFGPVDQLTLGFGFVSDFDAADIECGSPCSSIFYNDITLEVDEVAPVPLPATGALLAVAMAGLGWVRRRM